MNPVLEDVETQCSDRMSHWGMSSCFNCMMFQTCQFILLYFTKMLNLISFVNLNDLVLNRKCF